MAERLRWEYRFVPLGGVGDTGLNALGAEGWEAVCATGNRLLFKRPNDEPDEDSWYECAACDSMTYIGSGHDCQREQVAPR